MHGKVIIPRNIKIAWDTDRDILSGLAVVLQDDGDVHVDDNQEGDDEVRHQKGNGNSWVATVTRKPRLLIR